MRIAVFTSQFPGRVNTFFARDMRALLKANFEIDIFPIYPLNETLWRNVPQILNETILPRNRIYHLGFVEALLSMRPWHLRQSGRFVRDALSVTASAIRYGVMPFAKSAYVFPKAWAWAAQYPNRYDHVLAYWGNYAGTCAYVFHRLLGQPIPFSIFLHAGTDLYRDQVYLRKKLLYADNIIVVCEFNKEFIRELYPDIFPLLSKKIYLHHLGLDLREFRFESGGRMPQKIVGVGSHSKYKGFDYLLRATHQLLMRGKEVHLELVGEGEETESLQELAIELGIKKNVTFLGWLLPDDVKQAIKTARILVHPSIGLGDAVPTVIKEAMALGTPVIASNVAGIPELLADGRCGMLVPPRDVESLAGAIDILMASPQLQQEYTQAAFQQARDKFDMWKNGSRLDQRLRATQRHQLPMR
jgi:glycosyltransferase involved in cell wall biosynthesis